MMTLKEAHARLYLRNIYKHRIQNYFDIILFRKTKQKI